MTKPELPRAAETAAQNAQVRDAVRSLQGALLLGSRDRDAIFAIHPQQVYGSNAQPVTFPAEWVGTGKPAASANGSPLITLKHTAHAIVSYFCHIHWG